MVKCGIGFSGCNLCGTAFCGVFIVHLHTITHLAPCISANDDRLLRLV